MALYLSLNFPFERFMAGKDEVIISAAKLKSYECIYYGI